MGKVKQFNPQSIERDCDSQADSGGQKDKQQSEDLTCLCNGPFQSTVEQTTKEKLFSASVDFSSGTNAKHLQHLQPIYH